MQRIRAYFSGRVQGVGFRPYVYRYAQSQNLSGFVKNTPAGVCLEIQGPDAAIQEFFQQLQQTPPPQAKIETITMEPIPIENSQGFHIIASQASGELQVGMPPDLAICQTCYSELLSPLNRRYSYPFINCTDCGPRFTIIHQLPYDRQNTSMATFSMCSQCQAEYFDPADRRFDAQPNACPHCGPSLALRTATGLIQPIDPLEQVVQMLQQGAIIAVKGLGGYHLACDAKNEKAIRLLRERKARPHKSLAVMFRSLEEINFFCEVTEPEAKMLLSPAHPIVILPLRASQNLPTLLSPDTCDLGVFLPYTPLHVLLLSKISPLIMTSANLADEPILSDESELHTILGTVADYALTHNRPIIHACDDSVLKLVDEKPLFYRRSRGFIPEPVLLPFSGPSVLACGAELKNTFCLTKGQYAFLSQHIGDLGTYPAWEFYKKQINDLMHLLKLQPVIIAHDLHPDYTATHFAQSCDIVHKIPVQHHHAHIAAVMAEHSLQETVIGVALDGLGLGSDNTLWGSEFLITDYAHFQRRGHFKYYPLPGGEEAIRHPARMALSCLYVEFAEAASTWAEILLPQIPLEDTRLLLDMLAKKIHSPLTSSAGRLFDAVAALLGLCSTITYEGQAAIRLQALARPEIQDYYPFYIETDATQYIVSFTPMFQQLIQDIQQHKEPIQIASQFHNTLAQATVQMCEKLREQEQLNCVVLSGGVFQNEYLLKKVTNLLSQSGFQVYSHNLVPPNDGGIALGQAAVALAQAQDLT